MKADQVELELVGVDKLLDQISAAIALLASPRDLMDAIGAELEANIQLRFDTKVDASGAAWSPIKESTRKRYEHKYKGQVPGSLLERSGLMRDTLAYNATDDFVEVGFSAPATYAIWHVTGTKKMARRDPLFGWVNTEGTEGSIGAGDEADIVAVVDSFLNARFGL